MPDFACPPDIYAFGRIAPETKNPSFRCGAASSNSLRGLQLRRGDSLALSPNAVTVCDGGTTAKSGWRATKARICSPFSCGKTGTVT